MKFNKQNKVPLLYKRVLALILTCGLVLSITQPVCAKDIYYSSDTGIKLYVHGEGSYSNWDGVSNVSQFTDADGYYCFAYFNGKKTITIIKTKSGKKVGAPIKLTMKYSLFGDVTCDKNGNYYVASGRTNKTNDTSMKTIFVSKYDRNGKYLKMVSDNGSSSLAYYYDDSFYTRQPFDGGTCHMAVNGDILTVNYARLMYSGHQSNSVFTINTTTMKKVDTTVDYNSHSFAQRVIPYNDGFLYASEGDAFPRAFTVSGYDLKTGNSMNYDIFHFWLKSSEYSNMWVVNNNFAQMGGLCQVDNHHAALVGISATSMTSKAQNEKERLFIQIFNPYDDLSKSSSYVTSGTRTGTSGRYGDEHFTDYGVKWISSYESIYTIANPQVVSDGKGHIVVLYELYSSKNHSYQGVYYQVISANGKVLVPRTLFSKTAHLNPYRMPVYAKSRIYWTANKQNTNKLYIYSMKILQ